MRATFYLIIIFLVSLSCSSHKAKTDIETGLEGSWTFDLTQMGSQHSLIVMSNILTFKKNGDFSFPDTDCISWIVLVDTSDCIRLIFTSPIPEFNDTFDIQFGKVTDDKLLKLYLTSEIISLNCSKMSLNYNKSINQIDRLVSLTSKSCNKPQ